MTGRLRPWEAIDELQQKAIDNLYDHDERLALLETGFGKTLVAMTAGQELIEAGVVERPIVFAPLRVATNTWPQERFEWEHLKGVAMVEWGGPPDEWEDSLWKQSRTLWGQRLHAESSLRGAEARVRTKLDKAAAAKVETAAGNAMDPEQAAQHVLDYYRRKFEPNPNEVREAINAVVVPLEEKLDAVTAEEKRVNKLIRKTEPPKAWHVTSFENVEWFCNLYDPGESPFDLWIVDESGRLARNPTSPRYKLMRKHMPLAKIRWALNATPAPEGCEDLFGQVQIVVGKRLWGGSFYDWRKRFFVPEDYHGHTYRLQLGAFEPLMAELNTVAFRAPATAYTKSFTAREIEVDLPPKARAAYNAMEKQMAVEIAEGLDPVVAMSEATASSKLRQITQGYLYETDERGRRIVHHMHDEKTQALAELLDSMGREPLLIGFQFDEDLENVRKVFKNVPFIGQGSSTAQANDNITRWNKRELPALAVHANSASHGLNLQYGGHHICHLALPWGLDPYKQLNERLDRRGQTKPVYGHHIIARNSKDQDVSEALMMKDANQNRVIAAIRKLG